MNYVNQPSVCDACRNGVHEIIECPVFTTWQLFVRWNYVKKKKMCFICLSAGHRYEDCSKMRCQYCQYNHHSLLHNFSKVGFHNSNFYKPLRDELEKVDEHPPSMQNDGNPFKTSTFMHVWKSSNVPAMNSACTQQGTKLPSRCFLPIVMSPLLNKNRNIRAGTILDTGSELNVMSTNLNLTDTPLVINVIGVGGEVSQKRTMLVEVVVEDCMGHRTEIECIVLEKT